MRSRRIWWELRGRGKWLKQWLRCSVDKANSSEYMRVCACFFVIWGFAFLIFGIALRLYSFRSVYLWLYSPGLGRGPVGLRYGYYCVPLVALFALYMGCVASRSSDGNLGRFLIVAGIALIVAFFIISGILGPMPDSGWP
jgi:hypothetical protein